MGSATAPQSPAPSEIAVTSVKIERDKLDALKEIAAGERRSVSQQLRWLIDRCIEEHDEEPIAA